MQHHSATHETFAPDAMSWKSVGLCAIGLFLVSAPAPDAASMAEFIGIILALRGF